MTLELIIKKIDHSQNNQCRRCGDGKETIYHIISECSKLVQKENNLSTFVWERRSTGNCASGHSLDFDEELDKYLDLTWELKKLWDMKVTMIIIETGELGIDTKYMAKNIGKLEIRGIIETVLTIARLKLTRILIRKILEILWDFSSVRLHSKIISSSW